MIEWFAKNHVAANLLMFAIVLTGIVAARNEVALELMPDFQLGTITINTVLPGGNPARLKKRLPRVLKSLLLILKALKKSLRALPRISLRWVLKSSQATINKTC